MKGLKGQGRRHRLLGHLARSCVAEMPTMKKLYAEYKDKGVEFIGVSLDKKEGGLESSRRSSRRKESRGRSTSRVTAGTASSRRPGASTGSRPSSWSTSKASSSRSRHEDELETMIAELLSGRLAATTPAAGTTDPPPPSSRRSTPSRCRRIDDSRREDSAYIERYDKEKSQATKRKADLIGALYRADPDNPELATLLPERWQALASLVQGRHGKTVAKDLTGELNEVIARAKSDELKKDAAYWKAEVASSSAKDNAAKTEGHRRVHRAGPQGRARAATPLRPQLLPR